MPMQNRTAASNVAVPAAASTPVIREQKRKEAGHLEAQQLSWQHMASPRPMSAATESLRRLASSAALLKAWLRSP